MECRPASGASQDENENWVISVKLAGYGHLTLGDATKAVIWALENAPNGLTVAELADLLHGEGGLFQTDDVAIQHKYVRKRLYLLHSKGIVDRAKTPGRVLRWTIGSKGGPEAQAAQRDTKVRAFSENDWAIIQNTIPSVSRRQANGENTRRFVERVLVECGQVGRPRLAPSEASRFLVWHKLGVWERMAQALGGRLQADEFARLADRLFPLKPTGR